jgi:hypothetical protein
MVRGGGAAFGISREAAGALIAELATTEPAALSDAIARLIGAGRAEELERLRDHINQAPEPLAFESVEKPHAKQLRFTLEPSTGERGYVHFQRGYVHLESNSSPHGEGPIMILSIEAEELDGSFWGVATADEEKGVRAAESILPMITERKPLSRLLPELKRIAGS